MAKNKKAKKTNKLWTDPDPETPSLFEQIVGPLAEEAERQLSARYFLFQYKIITIYATDKDEGAIPVISQDGSFPSKKTVQEYVRAIFFPEPLVDEVIVIGWTEFNNSDDFMDYQGAGDAKE
ncbi:MAG: hypothetical protein KAU20_01290 [Nanoarchaeota archaeon]|nr:hypothetical protein [Nanoarchaeota archaeon]